MSHSEGAVAGEDVGCVRGALVIHIVYQQPEGPLQGRPVPLALLPHQHPWRTPRTLGPCLT